MSAQQQHSKIHLYRLAIPDNSICFTTAKSTLHYFNKKSGQDSSVDGHSYDFPSLQDVLPGSTAQAACDDSQKTEAIN